MKTVRVRLARDLTRRNQLFPPSLYDNFEEQERAFRLATVALKRMALRDLQDLMEGRQPRNARPLEDQEEALPSWDNPFVFVRIEYPLSDDEAFEIPANLKDEAEALWWIGDRLHEERHGKDHVISALQDLTHFAANVRRAGKLNPVVPYPFFDAYRSMSAEERDAFHRRWFSPTSHGDEYQEEAGRTVPGSDASIEVHDGVRAWRAALVFEVYPLFLDLDAGQAYYVIRAGLPWEGDMGSPATWRPAEREALWGAIARSFDTMERYYRGNTQAPPEVVEVEVEMPFLPPPVTAHDVVVLEASTNYAGAAAPAQMAETVITRQEAQAAITATANLSAHGRGLLALRVFPVAFGAARADRDALALVQHAHRLRLPRSWSKLKRWKDIVQEEVDALFEEAGPDAFKDRRAETKNPNAYAKLKKVWAHGHKQPHIELTPEEEERLRRAHGESARGFLDVDPYGREALYRCIPDAKGNLLEVWLSWLDLAGPLFPEWVASQKQMIKARGPERSGGQLLLFEDLENEQRRRLDRELDRLNVYEHGRAVMGALLGMVGHYRQNPVEVPAEAFRTLLWPHGNVPQDWKQAVDRTLAALMAMRCSWRAGSVKGGAVFVSSWQYQPLGKGGHGEGVYVVGLTEPFLGCLRLFETAPVRLRSGVDATVYDFNKQLPKEEKKALAFVTFDSGRVFYHAAAGLTAPQDNLTHWLEREITLRRDVASPSHKQVQVKHTAPNAREPRLYGHDFCPLLPKGKDYVGALGHFKRGPEAGRTLYGTARKGGKASGGATSGRTYGQHVDGLVAVAGYPLPAGNAYKHRRNAVQKTLEDLKAVVVDYLGGIVAGRLKGEDGKVQWLPLARFTELDEEALCRRLKIFPFLPPNWNQRRRDHFEKATGFRVTGSIPEAEAATWGTAAPPALPASAVPVEGRRAPQEGEEEGRILKGAEDGWRGLPLPSRLHAAMTHRGLKRTDLARIFGVTKQAVTGWLRGLKVDEDPGKAKRIPADLAALMARWIEHGTEPTPAELVALLSRQRAPRGGPKKQGGEGDDGKG